MVRVASKADSSVILRFSQVNVAIHVIVRHEQSHERRRSFFREILTNTAACLVTVRTYYLLDNSRPVQQAVPVAYDHASPPWSPQDGCHSECQLLDSIGLRLVFHRLGGESKRILYMMILLMISVIVTARRWVCITSTNSQMSRGLMSPSMQGLYTRPSCSS